MKRWLLLSLTISATSIAIADNSWPLRLQDLDEDENVPIEFEIGGCFSGDIRQLVFSGGDPATLTVSRRQLRPESRSNGKPIEIRLTDEEVAGVDRYIGYFRSSPPDECIGFRRLKISWPKYFRVDVTEEYSVATCGHVAEGAVALEELIRRADESVVTPSDNPLQETSRTGRDASAAPELGR